VLTTPFAILSYCKLLSVSFFIFCCVVVTTSTLLTRDVNIFTHYQILI
jgi:hypothetical protein